MSRLWEEKEVDVYLPTSFKQSEKNNFTEEDTEWVLMAIRAAPPGPRLYLPQAI